jgi:hypothetical protein
MLPTDQPPLSVIEGSGVENHLAAAAWYRLVIRNLIAIGEATDRVPIIPSDRVYVRPVVGERAALLVRSLVRTYPRRSRHARRITS